MSPFLSLFILLLMLPSNFIVSDVKSSRSFLYFKRNSIFYFIYVYNYWRIISDCLMFFLKYLIQKMIHYVIQTLYSILELIFWKKYFCMTFLYFSTYSKCKGFMKQHIYLFSLSLLYLKDSVIVCNDQMFYYSQNS